MKNSIMSKISNFVDNHDLLVEIIVTLLVTPIALFAGMAVFDFIFGYTGRYVFLYSVLVLCCIFLTMCIIFNLRKEIAECFKKILAFVLSNTPIIRVIGAFCLICALFVGAMILKAPGKWEPIVLPVHAPWYEQDDPDLRPIWGEESTAHNPQEPVVQLAPTPVPTKSPVDGRGVTLAPTPAPIT